MCAVEVLFSQHLRGLKPETPVSWQLCRQSMSKILLCHEVPQVLTCTMTPKTLLWCSWLPVLTSKEESSFRPRGRAEVSCTGVALLPRNQGQDLYPFTTWDSHSLKSNTALWGILSYILCLAIEVLLPVHCSSIAFICSFVNFQNTASFFHSRGFNWLYARFQREERICLVCVVWSCLKDTLKSDPLPLWARCVWKRKQMINFVTELGNCSVSSVLYRCSCWQMICSVPVKELCMAQKQNWNKEFLCLLLCITKLIAK